MFERKSELHNVSASRGRYGADGMRTLQIGEFRGFEILQVASFPSSWMEVNRAIQSVVGVDLPKRAGLVTRTDKICLFKVGSEQFWIVTSNGHGLFSALQSKILPSTGSTTSLGHSRTRIFVEGMFARELLAKAISLDLHPDYFQLDFFALTGLHHTPILLHRAGENRYELYTMRTFATWVWEWLTDAALPLGYDVVSGPLGETT